MTPFIVYALPRSRTYWLSQFLTVGGYHCAHDQARHLRTIEDIRCWLAQDWTGTVETAGAHGWRVVRSLRPDARVLVVRRPVIDVLASLERQGIHTTDTLARRLRILDRRLDRIGRAPGVLSLSFDALDTAEGCAAVFRHCLGADMPERWWRTMAPLNLQCDLPAMLRYAEAHRRQIGRLAHAVVRETRDVLALDRMEREAATLPPLVIREESLAVVRNEGASLVAAHAAEVGPRDGAPLRVNWPLLEQLDAAAMLQMFTARAGGRLVGYLMHVMGPSPENGNVALATQGPFYLAPAFRGAGIRLVREAIARLWARGIQEIDMGAGVRSAPNLGALYRRMGAREAGTIYHLTAEG